MHADDLEPWIFKTQLLKINDDFSLGLVYIWGWDLKG